MPHYMDYFKMSQNILEATWLSYDLLDTDTEFLKRTHPLCYVVKYQRTDFPAAKCFPKGVSHHMS